MRTIFSTFDFKNADLAMEERNYADNHVRLAKQLPGLRLYLTGLVAKHAQHPTPHRAVFLSFDDADALKAGVRKSPVAKPLADDGAAHIVNNRWFELESEVIVPFESKRPGLRCFVMAAQFDLKLDGSNIAAAEKRYLEHHTQLARRLPGLRHYMIGKFADAVGMRPEFAATPDRFRMAMLVFDSVEALRDAYRSPAGQALVQDEDATIANARVYRLDATVQV
ncbi:MAG TPA: EthD family reductase [Candidatus Binataceae bacterium]|nr:EthD family reductase [Candidatus Binataceae bacterium]